MKAKWGPVRGQKFDIGRTINPQKCFECETCDYIHCQNYGVKTARQKYTLQEFVDFHKADIELGWTEDLIGDLLENVAPKFPKGLWWGVNKSIFNDNVTIIKFVNFTRYGEEDLAGYISTNERYHVFDRHLSQAGKKLANRVSLLLKEADELAK